MQLRSEAVINSIVASLTLQLRTCPYEHLGWPCHSRNELCRDQLEIKFQLSKANEIGEKKINEAW